MFRVYYTRLIYLLQYKVYRVLRARRGVRCVLPIHGCIYIIHICIYIIHSWSQDMIAVYTCTCDKVKTKKYYTCIRLIRYNIRGASLSDAAPRRQQKGKKKKRYFRSDPIEMECTSRSDSSQWSCENARVHIL